MTTLRKQAKAKARWKDYVKKRNIKQNNWPQNQYRARFPLVEGDGILPRSRKYPNPAKKLSIKINKKRIV